MRDVSVSDMTELSRRMCHLLAEVDIICRMSIIREQPNTDPARPFFQHKCPNCV